MAADMAPSRRKDDSMPRLAPALSLLLAAAVPALASSDDAWQEFAKEVGEEVPGSGSAHA